MLHPELLLQSGLSSLLGKAASRKKSSAGCVIFGNGCPNSKRVLSCLFGTQKTSIKITVRGRPLCIFSFSQYAASNLHAFLAALLLMSKHLGKVQRRATFHTHSSSF
jgi:hypothetical protein